MWSSILGDFCCLIQAYGGKYWCVGGSGLLDQHMWIWFTQGPPRKSLFSAWQMGVLLFFLGGGGASWPSHAVTALLMHCPSQQLSRKGFLHMEWRMNIGTSVLKPVSSRCCRHFHSFFLHVTWDWLSDWGDSWWPYPCAELWLIFSEWHLLSKASG